MCVLPCHMVHKRYTQMKFSLKFLIEMRIQITTKKRKNIMNNNLSEIEKGFRNYIPPFRRAGYFGANKLIVANSYPGTS